MHSLSSKAAQMAFAIRHTTGIVCIVADKAPSHPTANCVVCDVDVFAKLN